jgi:hypothetical protein
VTPATDETAGKPPWLLPGVVILVVAIVIGVGRKKEAVVENPLVDLAIITIGVFAFAAGFRFIGTKLGSPGFDAFFGGAPSSEK